MVLTLPLQSPSALILHLSRSSGFSRGGVFVKNHCRVVAPEILILDNFLTGGILNTRADLPLSHSPAALHSKYRLQAVVVHYGSHSFGHFLCYRRGPTSPDTLEGPWYRVSDEETSVVSLAEVLESNPTLLFYDRMPTTAGRGERPFAPLDLTSLQAWSLDASRMIRGSGPPKVA